MSCYFNYMSFRTFSEIYVNILSYSPLLWYFSYKCKVTCLISCNIIEISRYILLLF